MLSCANMVLLTSCACISRSLGRMKHTFCRHAALTSCSQNRGPLIWMRCAWAWSFLGGRLLGNRVQNSFENTAFWGVIFWAKFAFYKALFVKNTFFLKKTCARKFEVLLSGPSWPFLSCSQLGPELGPDNNTSNGIFAFSLKNALKYLFS